jgi:uncharacterized protein with HEPN domain
MPTTALERLNHICERVALIRQLLASVPYDEAWRDKNRWAAFERHLEVISEAAKTIPPAWKAEQPGIDWQGILGLGNILRHTYHHASAPILWSIYEHDLDPLEAAIDAMIVAHNNDQPGG